MHRLKKKIFGFPIRFELNQKEIFDILSVELKNYASYEEETNEITISDSLKLSIDPTANNPSSFVLFENGFQTETTLIKYRLHLKNKEVNLIEFEIKEKPGLFAKLRKWTNIQYTNRRERIGQILHESIFVPILFFQKNRLLIHASGTINSAKEVTLFGGTGGVGKTSIELLSCFHNSCNFISDDLAVLNGEKVYLNLNFPKIYAYNVLGYPKIQKKLFHNLSLVDKLFWKIKLLQGPNKVRRRVEPFEFFKSQKVILSSNIKRYIILKRSNVQNLGLENIDLEKAARLSWSIIQTELAEFFRTIHFLEINSASNPDLSFLSFGEIKKNYFLEFERSFKNAELKILNIPIKMEHKEFMSEVQSVLKELELLE